MGSLMLAIASCYKIFPRHTLDLPPNRSLSRHRC